MPFANQPRSHMTPSEFLKTVYLGDRACKAVVIDGWRNEIKFNIDCVSRVRGGGLFIVNPPWMLKKTLQEVMAYLVSVLGQGAGSGAGFAVESSEN